jgi:hypothetical protein
MMRRAVASPSFLLRKKENIGATLRKRACNFRRWQFQVALNGGAETRAPRSALTGLRFSLESDCIATTRGWSRYKLIENANGIPIFHDLPINGSQVDNMIFWVHNGADVNWAAGG